MRKLKIFCFLVLFTLSFALSAQAGVTVSFERGQAAMLEEDWFSAVGFFLESLRLNPAHAGATAALAEAYFELGELEQALTWVRRARTLSRTNTSLANLEASTLVALGHLDEASRIINEVLQREPFNREALFVAAELDVARGRAGDAVRRYQDAARRFPDDRRLLVSLALVLGSMGDTQSARSYIDRALLAHPGDFRVYYYAAFLASQQGRLNDGIWYAENALHYRPGFAPARSLLASLYYRSGRYEDAIALADELITLNRDNSSAWYLKGISLARLDRFEEAKNILSIAVDIDPENEFIRAALEEILITRTRLEDPVRERWAAWHFNRARDFRSRNLMEQALFQYRRGLRLNPYAWERREYADLLRLQGYPARFLEELLFMQGLGLADQNLNDAVESFNAMLSTALFRRWDVDPIMATQPHWNVAIFTLNTQAGFFHPDAGVVAASFLRDIMVHERNVRPMNLELRQSDFASAFRTAREGGADYFLILSVTESERDLSLSGELFVARTGARAASFNSFRTGGDRLRFASRNMVDQLTRALPFRAELIQRRQNLGLIDKGRADGVRDGDEFLIVQRGRIDIQNEGIGFVFSPEDVVGRLVIERADEEVSAGFITREGFFDRISPGDEVIMVRDIAEVQAAGFPVVNPELRTLLRMLR